MVNKLVYDFYKTFIPSESFSEGATKIAKLFVRFEESINPAEILRELLEHAPSPKVLEYLVLSFLDTRESDYDVILYSCRFKRLSRLFYNIINNSREYSSEAYHIFNTVNMVCKINSPQELSIASQITMSWLQRLQNGNKLTEREYMQLSLLIRGEATALKLQSDFVSSNADAYNMKKMIRLLPLVSSADELSQRIIETSDKLAQNRAVGEPVLSFEYALKSDQFQKWLKKVSSFSENEFFIKTLLLQRSKMIPAIRLAAVESIIRFIRDDKGGPVEWLYSAIENSSKKGFKIDTGNSLQKIMSVLHDGGILAHESCIYGNFNSISINNFIGPDRLSRVLDSRKEFSIQELVIMGMRNDALMCRLLDSPKMYNVPRLIEYVAKTSRSITVLTKIATTKELHTGLINNSVPLALISNPTHLPIGLLRQFINPRYISLNDMKFLVRTPYGLRQDIYNEIKSFIERKN